jgi:hypothetical protein
VALKDDFRAYLLSDDAQQAEAWQLAFLQSLRRGLGRPASQATYERWRAEIALDAQAPRSVLTAR